MRNLQRKKFWNENTGGGRQIQLRTEFKAKSIKLETNRNKLIGGTDLTYTRLCVDIVGLSVYNMKYIKACKF